MVTSVADGEQLLEADTIVLASRGYADDGLSEQIKAAFPTLDLRPLGLQTCTLKKAVEEACLAAAAT